MSPFVTRRDGRWPLTVSVLAAELFELAPQRFPILAVEGLLRPHFRVERRAKVVQRSVLRESNQRAPGARQRK